MWSTLSGLEVMLLSMTWSWMLLVGKVQRRWMYQSHRFRKCVVHLHHGLILELKRRKKKIEKKTKKVKKESMNVRVI
ncbi:hypothetical protein AHAS_Ahas07G0106500 [Arachis hypogaea]